jgi:mono/diheme cytochrome c family protein
LRPPRNSPRTLAALLAGGFLLVAAGCGGDEPDLANGKRMFAGEGQCGSCHTLARANTRGSVGPNLDRAFAQARRDGMNEDTVEGIVHYQIAHPRRSSVMKPNLVEGDDARDVAAYVGYAAAKPGKDTGLLAAAGQPKKGPPIAAKGGTLTIPADPTGALSFASDKATAPPGQIKIESPNESPIQHNIALRPGPAGPVVGNGGVSQISVSLQPRSYIFFCSVPGHEAGGMKGTLTVSR